MTIVTAIQSQPTFLNDTKVNKTGFEVSDVILSTI